MCPPPPRSCFQWAAGVINGGARCLSLQRRRALAARHDGRDRAAARPVRRRRARLEPRRAARRVELDVGARRLLGRDGERARLLRLPPPLVRERRPRLEPDRLQPQHGRRLVRPSLSSWWRRRRPSRGGRVPLASDSADDGSLLPVGSTCTPLAAERTTTTPTRPPPLFRASKWGCISLLLDRRLWRRNEHEPHHTTARLAAASGHTPRWFVPPGPPFGTHHDRHHTRLGSFLHGDTLRDAPRSPPPPFSARTQVVLGRRVGAPVDALEQARLLGARDGRLPSPHNSRRIWPLLVVVKRRPSYR